MATVDAKDVDDCLLTHREEDNRCKEGVTDLKQHMVQTVNRRGAVSDVEESAEETRSRDLDQHEAQMKQLELLKTSKDATRESELSLQQAVIQRASSQTSTLPPSVPPSSSSAFMSEKKEEAENILSKIGSVSLGTDPESSSIEGLSVVGNTVLCRPWSLPLSIRVVSRDCRGVECCRGGDRVESVLTPTSCGVSVQGEVEDKGDGTYQITFACLPSEECRLSVTVNGSDVRGSPVKVKLNNPSIIKQEFKVSKGRHFYSLMCTKEGTLLATDNGKHEVCSITQSGELLRSYKVLYTGMFVLPGLAVLNNGNIAVSVMNRRCIEVSKPNGKLVMEFGSYKLAGPHGLAVNRRGQLFVADGLHHRVCVFTEDGVLLYSFGSRGSDPGQFNYVDQICIGHNDLVYIGDFNNDRIQVFQQDGQFVQQFGQGVMKDPKGLAVTKDGHIVVASAHSNKLFVFAQSGKCVHEVKGIGLNEPVGVAIAEDGSIFVADHLNCRIVKL